VYKSKYQNTFNERIFVYRHKKNIIVKPIHSSLSSKFNKKIEKNSNQEFFQKEVKWGHGFIFIKKFKFLHSLS